MFLDDRMCLVDFPTGADVTLTYTATGRRDLVTDARGITDYDRRLRRCAEVTVTSGPARPPTCISGQDSSGHLRAPAASVD